jgi:lysophospholipase L1-like esterase
LGAVLVFAAAACASAPPCSAQSSETHGGRDACAPGAAAAKPPAPVQERRPRPLFSAVPIEDPSGKAMASFHAALRSAEEQKGQARIVFYGASHVAADIYTEVVRSRLQSRFGEAGAGFTMAAKSLPHYRHSGIAFDTSSNWSGSHVKGPDPSSDQYGLAGMYVVSPAKRTAHSSFTTHPHSGLTGNVSDIELYYWKHPEGGHFKISIDGKAHEIATNSKSPSPGYQRYTVPDGQHRVEIVTKGDGTVRLFGIALERSEPGVILDELGIPGARAANQLQWDDAVYREQLMRRRPDLVVLAYGTNEAGDDGQPIDEYAENLRRVVGRVRQVVPHASCLLIGPSDRPTRNDEGTYTDRPRTSAIVATQRQVAAEFGCGFFDMVAFMGGPLSMLSWCSEEPPMAAPDHVHFTPRGYETFGNVLYEALLTGYGNGRTPLVLGPRPLAPPGSSVSELESEPTPTNGRKARPVSAPNIRRSP